MREFQTDAPMSPFLYTDLYSILKTLLKRFVKAEVLENTNLLSIAVNKSANLMDAKELKIGFATGSAIKRCKQTYGKANVNEKTVLHFREDCQKILQKMVTKFVERTPLKYSFTKGMICFDPAIFVKTSLAAKRLESVLSKLVENNIISGAVADRASNEFTSLSVDSDVIESCKSYSRELRVDHF